MLIVEWIERGSGQSGHVGSGMCVLCKLIGCFANYKFISLSNNIHVVFYAHLIIYVDG